MMSRPHLVRYGLSAHMMWAVYRVAGVLSTLWAILMGLWSLLWGSQIYSSRAWEPMRELIGPNLSVLGWTILFGGVLGVAGLFTNRWVSVASCAVCIVWCGWIFAFLGWSSINGAPNLGVWLAALCGLVYISRLWLLFVTPGPG